MNLDNYALLSFISADMPLAKAVLILVFFVLLLEIIHEATLHLESFS